MLGDGKIEEGEEAEVRSDYIFTRWRYVEPTAYRWQIFFII